MRADGGRRWPRRLLAIVLVAILLFVVFLRVGADDRVQFAQDVELTEVALPAEILPGAVATATFTIHPRHPLDRDLWFFVHAESPGDAPDRCRVVADRAFDLPPTKWGDFTIEHRVSIAVPPTCKPGRLDVYVGLADHDTWARLPILRPHTRDDRLLAGSIQIVPGAADDTPRAITPKQARFWALFRPWIAPLFALAFSAVAIAYLARRRRSLSDAFAALLRFLGVGVGEPPPLVVHVIAWIVAGFVAWTALFEIRVLSSEPDRLSKLEGWFYPAIHRAAPPLLATVVLAASLVLLARGALPTRGSVRARLFCVMIAGVGIQLGCALVEGRGLYALRDRVMSSGHAEFSRIASSGVSIDDVLTRYEELVTRRIFGVFAATKPPGTLLFYVLSERFIHALFPANPPHDRLEWLANFAAFAWPVFSLLSIWPLFSVARTLFGEERAFLGCAVAVVTPSFVLITLHTDQVLFPVVVNLTLASATLAAFRDDLRLAFVAGVLGYLACFCSFGLFAALPLVLALVAIGAARAEKPKRHWTLTSLRTLVVAALGVACTWAIAAWALRYDLMQRYKVAIAAHLAWKNWQGTPHEIRHFAFLNVVEFVVWIGLPVAALVLVAASLGLASSLRSLKPTPLLLGAAIVATIAALAWMGKTKAESARLWLFLAQPCAVVAAGAIGALFPTRARLLGTALVAGQIAIVIALKRYFDFW